MSDVAPRGLNINLFIVTSNKSKGSVILTIMEEAVFFIGANHFPEK